MRHFSWVYAVVFLCLLGGSSLAQKNAVPGQAVQNGRYQLFAVRALSQTVGGGQDSFDEVFVLDSLTGRVWKFMPYHSIGDGEDKVGVPEGFDELVVDNLNGDTRLDQLTRYATAEAVLRKQKHDKEVNDMLKRARESRQAAPDAEPPK